MNKVKEEGAEATLAEKQHPTILRELIFNESLPPSEREFYRVMSEAGLVLNAGHETTGNALNALHFHLLANPQKLNKLKEELKEEITGQWDVPNWQQLKKLPYLVGLS
jgi:cytochrome P450